MIYDISDRYADDIATYVFDIALDLNFGIPLYAKTTFFVLRLVWLSVTFS